MVVQNQLEEMRGKIPDGLRRQMLRFIYRISEIKEYLHPPPLLTYTEHDTPFRRRQYNPLAPPTKPLRIVMAWQLNKDERTEFVFDVAGPSFRQVYYHRVLRPAGGIAPCSETGLDDCTHDFLIDLRDNIELTWYHYMVGSVERAMGDV